MGPSADAVLIAARFTSSQLGATRMLMPFAKIFNTASLEWESMMFIEHQCNRAHDGIISLQRYRSVARILEANAD